MSQPQNEPFPRDGTLNTLIVLRDSMGALTQLPGVHTGS